MAGPLPETGKRWRGLPSWAAILLAASIAAGLSALTGVVIRAAVPGGCGTRVGINIYQWACLMPGALFLVAPVCVSVLAAASLASRAVFHWMVQHPILLAGLAAVVCQSAIVVFFGLLDASRRSGDLAWDLFVLPQPFLAGGCATLVFAFLLRRATKA